MMKSDVAVVCAWCVEEEHWPEGASHAMCADCSQRLDGSLWAQRLGDVLERYAPAPTSWWRRSLTPIGQVAAVAGGLGLAAVVVWFSDWVAPYLVALFTVVP